MWPLPPWQLQQPCIPGAPQLNCPKLKPQARPSAPCASHLPVTSCHPGIRMDGRGPPPLLLRPLALSHPRHRVLTVPPRKKELLQGVPGPTVQRTRTCLVPLVQFGVASRPQSLSHLLLLLSISPAGRAHASNLTWSPASPPAFRSALHTAAADSTVTCGAEHVSPQLKTPWWPSTAPTITSDVLTQAPRPSMSRPPPTPAASHTTSPWLTSLQPLRPVPVPQSRPALPTSGPLQRLFPGSRMHLLACVVFLPQTSNYRLRPQGKNTEEPLPQMALGKLDSHMWKSETDHSYAMHETKLKMEERSKCET